MNRITTPGQTIKTFILSQFLPDDDPDELLETTDLVGGGIMDSLATLKLVNFLEEEFSISVEPQEANADNLKTIAAITALVESKL